MRLVNKFSNILRLCDSNPAINHLEAHREKDCHLVVAKIASVDIWIRKDSLLQNRLLFPVLIAFLTFTFMDTPLTPTSSSSVKEEKTTHHEDLSSEQNVFGVLGVGHLYSNCN